MGYLGTNPPPEVLEIAELFEGLGHEVVTGEPGFGSCSTCSETHELRMGVCFDCANSGEIRSAKRTVTQHLLKCARNLSARKFEFARYDITWAWQRLTKTGDYEPGGYFDDLLTREAP